MRGPGGETSGIEVLFTFDPPEQITFDDDATGLVYSGATAISSRGSSHSIRLSASDELQYAWKGSLMQSALGPRTIFYADELGHSHPIIITVWLDGTETVDLGAGHAIIEHVGTYEIKSDLFNRTMRLTGQDELQVLYRCIWLSDLWLQTAAKNFGVKLYTIVEDQPVEKAFDVYA